MRPLFVFSVLGLSMVLSACEQLGIETPAQQQVRAEAEGKAIGGSCRHSGRALEDCYQINPKAPKAAVFDGWRDMDAYMRENKLETVAPLFPMTPPPPKKKPVTTPPPPAADEAGAAPAEKKPEAEKAH